MKTLSAISAGTCFALGSLCLTSNAALNDGDFETPGFSGWTIENPRVISGGQLFGQTVGAIGVMQSWGVPPDFASTRLPQAGNGFAALRTRANGNFSGESSYSFSLSQNVELDQGSQLSGWAFFYNGDLVPQDLAWVRIFDEGGNLISTPWLEGYDEVNHTSMTPFTATEWTFWQWEAPTSGLYTLRLGMSTSGNNNGASFGFFDNLNITPPNSVPEPGSLALVAIGGILLALRRKRN